MATTFAILTPESGVGIGSNYPEQGIDAQSRRYLAYDAATEEIWEWGNLICPQGFTGTMTATISYYMATATSGVVRGGASVEAVTPGDALDLDSASSFDTENAADHTVATTGQYLNPTTYTITCSTQDSLAAGDIFRFRFARKAAHANDTAAGDMRVMSIELRF